jgi:hypothetical protein
MLSATIQTYGGPFADESAVGNPTTEQSAALGNRTFEDLAQATHTSAKARLKFATSATAGPIPITVNADSTTQWGSGSFYFPTIQKTTTGTYVATYATEYDDALVLAGLPEGITETVNFKHGHPSVHGSTYGRAQISLASNVVTVYVFNAAGSLSDLGGTVTVDVELA